MSEQSHSVLYIEFTGYNPKEKGGLNIWARVKPNHKTGESMIRK